MVKTTRLISIDVDLNEMAKVKRIQDPTFKLSETINGFLRDFFGEDIKNLDELKLRAKKADLERELALVKSQEAAIEREDARQKEENEKKFGKEVQLEEK